MVRFFNRLQLALFAGLALAAPCTAQSQNTHPAALPDPAVAAADPGVKRLSEADTDFGFQMLHQLTPGQPARNVFFSPFSISQALLLTASGAGGKTQQDMARTLGLPGMPQAEINAANALLLPSLTRSDPKVKVSSANALWAGRGVTFSPAFQSNAKRYYGAEATTLDFSSPTAAGTINGWVSKNTQGKITQIVGRGDIARAEVVLTNAVYFHGKWQLPFDKGDTQDGLFTLADGKTKTVPLMSQENRFAYLETPQFQAVSLPYGAGRMSLSVFLPKQGTSIDSLTQALSIQTFSGWIGVMKPARMTLVLPRFKADYTATLNAPLTALGMGSAFGGQADFQPMGLHKSHISAVVHKAVLEVDEEGTVAAAATAVGVTAMARQPIPTITMRVDHPFFCAIRDTLTGAVLFEGVIQDPH